MLLLALVHAQNGPTAVGRVREGFEEGRGESGKQGILQQCSKNVFGKHLTVPTHYSSNLLKHSCYFRTCPEGSSLPVMVVMGEAGEAWHAACVVVLEPLQEFT